MGLSQGAVALMAFGGGVNGTNDALGVLRQFRG